MSAFTKQSPQHQSFSSRLSPTEQMLAPPQSSSSPSYGSYQQPSPTYQSQQTPSRSQSQRPQPSTQSASDAVPTTQPQQSSPQTESSYQPNNVYNDAASIPLPQIVGSGPSQGPQGEEYTVLLTSSVDLTTDSRSFKIMFGSRRCNTTIRKQLDAQGFEQFALSTQVPPMSLTGWFGSNRVSVYMNVEDEQGQELSTEQVSDYTYTDVSPPQSYTTSPLDGSRKRKEAPIDDRATSPSSKRLSGLPDMRAKGNEYAGYPYPTTTAPFSSYMSPTAGGDRSFEGLYDHHSQADRQVNANFNKQRPLSALYSSSFNFRPRSELPQYPQATSTGVWPSVYALAGGPGMSGMPSGGSTPSSQALGSISSPSDPSNPPLVRTSTLQQTSQSAPGNAGAPFNPYAVYPNRAVLKIAGSLDSMAEHWSEEEWHNRRRLVQFWRQQKGNAIHASFAPVSQSDRQSNSICISCIWWAEKNAAYVTSVDCIYLLESLIAVRFTVEEKNRIRRNLEGFHPLTVSKAKQDSENFFKLIMGFPNPKPRNIEKDVKVFPWKILGMALKKIIGKYSASYSSTASALPSVTPPSGYPGGPAPLQRASSDGPTGSPRSVTESSTSSVPLPDPTLGRSSPALKNPLQHPSPLSRDTNLPMHGSGLQASPLISGSWHQPSPTHPQMHHQLHAPRASWDLAPGLNSYLDHSGPTSASSQNLQYHKGHPITNGS